MIEIERLTNKTIQRIAREVWKSVIKHTKSIIEDA